MLVAHDAGEVRLLFAVLTATPGAAVDAAGLRFKEMLGQARGSVADGL